MKVEHITDVTEHSWSDGTAWRQITEHQTDRHTDTLTDTHTHRHTHRQTDRHTHRQTATRLDAHPMYVVSTQLTVSTDSQAIKQQQHQLIRRKVISH